MKAHNKLQPTAQPLRGFVGKTSIQEPVNIMKNYKSITYKEEYIQAESNGEKNLEFAKELWSQIVGACEKHKCYGSS